MAAETQYTANTGLTQISTGNTSLTGSGVVDTDIWSVVTAAANGTLVKSLRIKATEAVAEGMVRFFIHDGTNTRLIQEIHVPANTPSATSPAFEYVWDCDIKLKAANKIYVTTQVTDTFNIIADALDWAYYSTSVRPESTNFTANTGSAVLSSGNSSLTGSGTIDSTIWVILTAGASGSGWKGCRIESVSIKALTTTTMGMVRLFLYNGSATRLLTEIPIPAITQSATEKSYEQKINLNNFSLKAGWEIRATTENSSQSIAVVVEGNDWKYPA